MKGESIETFESLKQKFHLPPRSYFSYLQMSSWVTKRARQNNKHSHDNTIAELERVCLAPKPPQRSLSLLYNILTKRAGVGKLRFMTAWEAEMKTIIPNEIWPRVLRAHKHLTLNTAHIETCRKVLYRWYMVPYRLHKMDQTKKDQTP
ncbi:Hypothetical predicted protein, partial [Pelobates cultripes]